MTRFAKLQLIGPLVLFGAVLVAEGAAYALSMRPSSELLWRMNLEWFAAFQRTYSILDQYGGGIAYVQLIGVALPLLVMALFGCSSGLQLPLAIASNLSFVYASFVASTWWQTSPTSHVASLTLVQIPSAPDFYLLLVLLGASALSFIISHVLYVRAVRVAAPCRPC